MGVRRERLTVCGRTQFLLVTKTLGSSSMDPVEGQMPSSDRQGRPSQATLNDQSIGCQGSSLPIRRHARAEEDCRGLRSMKEHCRMRVGTARDSEHRKRRVCLRAPHNGESTHVARSLLKRRPQRSVRRIANSRHSKFHVPLSTGKTQGQSSQGCRRSFELPSLPTKSLLPKRRSRRKSGQGLSSVHES